MFSRTPTSFLVACALAVSGNSHAAVTTHAPAAPFQDACECPEERVDALDQVLLSSVNTGILAEVRARRSDRDLTADPSASRHRVDEADARRTPLSAREAAEALGDAWRRRVGHVPNRETLAILTAHWAHETNQGASMFNYNFGGLKGAGPDGKSVVRWTREGSGVAERYVSHRFRAYADPADGAVDYLTLLQKRYRPALDAAERGDVGGFVKDLKAGGYFSGDEGVYSERVTNLATLALDVGLNSLTRRSFVAAAPRTVGPETG